MLFALPLTLYHHHLTTFTALIVSGALSFSLRPKLVPVCVFHDVSFNALFESWYNKYPAGFEVPSWCIAVPKVFPRLFLLSPLGYKTSSCLSPLSDMRTTEACWYHAGSQTKIILLPVIWIFLSCPLKRLWSCFKLLSRRWSGKGWCAKEPFMNTNSPVHAQPLKQVLARSAVEKSNCET